MSAQPIIQTIALDQLVASERYNARRTGGDNVDDLVASIRADGLLQNLTVIPADGGVFEVVAGSRRLRALQALAESGELVLAGVPCRVVDPDVAMDASTAENTIREQMHPADEVDAYARMHQAGRTPDDIAVRFGQSRRHVNRMLRLATLSPAIMEQWRQDELDTDQAQGLALTDDHALQEEVWGKVKDCRWNNDGESIRRILTEDEVPLTSALGKYVGVDAYEAAGGYVRRDLFADADQVYLVDRELVEKLAMEKLEASAERQRKKGWLWVDPALEVSYGMTSKLERVYDKDPEELAIAGVFVTVGPGGRAETVGPYIRPSDRAAAERGEDPAQGCGEKAPPAPKDSFSNAQVERLHGWRTAILRKKLASNPELLIRALTAELAMDVLELDGLHSTIVHASARPHWVPRGVSDGLEDAAAFDVTTAAEVQAWTERIKQAGAADDLLGWLITQPMETTLELLALAVAPGILAADQDPEAEAAFMALAGFDARADWGPDAEWLQTLTKPTILRIVREVLGAEQAEAIASMKKGELAIKASELLTPTDYVPAPLRPAGFDAPWSNAP